MKRMNTFMCALALVLPLAIFAAAFSPTDLFDAGEDGVVIVPGDSSLTVLYTERTGSSATTVAGDGDPVGTIHDKVNDEFFTAASDTERAVLQKDSAGFWYLDFDGVDDQYTSVSKRDPLVSKTDGFLLVAATKVAHIIQVNQYYWQDKHRVFQVRWEDSEEHRIGVFRQDDYDDRSIIDGTDLDTADTKTVTQIWLPGSGDKIRARNDEGTTYVGDGSVTLGDLNFTEYVRIGIYHTSDDIMDGRLYGLVIANKYTEARRDDLRKYLDFTSVTVTLDPTDANASEEGPDSGTVRVQLDWPTISDVVVSYSVSGTAAPADYTETFSGVATISAGETSAALTVTPVDDDLFELDENVVFTIDNGSAYTIGSPSSAAVIISDNEMTPASLITYTNTKGYKNGVSVHYAAKYMGGLKLDAQIYYSASETGIGPKDIQIWLDLDADGTYAKGEKFDLTLRQDEVDYEKKVLYGVEGLSVPDAKIKTEDITYRFYALTRETEAVGEATKENTIKYKTRVELENGRESAVGPSPLDARHDKARVIFNADAKSEVSIYIFSSIGKLVWKKSGVSAEKGANTVFWSGKNA